MRGKVTFVRFTQVRSKTGPAIAYERQKLTEADITNGVLTLKLPKAESARPKQIKIKSR